MVSQCVCVCVFAGSGAGPGAYSQSQQPPTGSTTPSHQPVMGLAQAQANNSNNKIGTYTGTSMSVQESNLPEDLQRLMDDWAQEVLIVTQGSRSNSLSISRQQLWDQVVPQKHGPHAGALDVSFRPIMSPVFREARPIVKNIQHTTYNIQRHLYVQITNKDKMQ